jgi:hypothetical protein
MPRLDPCDLSRTILDAPAWVRLGLAVRSERLRERAALELASRIVEAGEGRAELAHEDQLTLAF